MQHIIENIRTEFQQAKQEGHSAQKLWQTFLSRNGKVSQAFERIKEVDEHERKAFGQNLNALKDEIYQEIQDLKEREQSYQEPIEILPVSSDAIQEERGHISIISQTIYEMQNIFERLGFSVVQGRQMETEWYNFDALNIPAGHPARDMWDTVWVQDTTETDQGTLMRTHTSPVQIRHMEEHKPPYRIVAPGPVYRYEATDATHETVFHQMEGLMVDETTNIATFKGVMETFFRYLFDEEIEIRLRPSYFPFTEPSFEIDLKWPESDEWLEVFGAGMVHKQVLKNVGVNPQYQGFAFGMGIERIIMLKYGITDIRHFHSADLGFIQQF